MGIYAGQNERGYYWHWGSTYKYYVTEAERNADFPNVRKRQEAELMCYKLMSDMLVRFR